MKPRIGMITLGVDDLPRAIAFYEKGLGFPHREARRKKSCESLFAPIAERTAQAVSFVMFPASLLD